MLCRVLDALSDAITVPVADVAEPPPLPTFTALLQQAAELLADMRREYASAAEALVAIAAALEPGDAGASPPQRLHSLCLRSCPLGSLYARARPSLVSAVIANTDCL